MQKLWIEVYRSSSGDPGSFQLKTVEVGYPIGFHPRGVKHAVIAIDLRIRDLPLYKPFWSMGEWLLLVEQGARLAQEIAALLCTAVTEGECVLSTR
jgi:hypothetical protein